MELHAGAPVAAQARHKRRRMRTGGNNGTAARVLWVGLAAISSGVRAEMYAAPEDVTAGSYAHDSASELCEQQCIALFRYVVDCGVLRGGGATCGECLPGFVDDGGKNLACGVGDGSVPKLPSFYDDSDDGDSSAIGLQVCLAIGFGVLLLLLICSVAWRGLMDCCSRSRRHSQHRAYFHSAQPGWSCSICWNENPSLQSHCVMCGTDPAEQRAIGEKLSSASVGTIDTEYHLLSTPTAAQLQRVSFPCSLLNEQQAAAVERHAWKRCIDRDNIRWVRIEDNELRSQPLLRGTFVAAKMLKADYQSNSAKRARSQGCFPSCTIDAAFYVRVERGSLMSFLSVEESSLCTRSYHGLKELTRVSLLPFKDKTRWFYHEALRMKTLLVDGTYTIHVHREHVLKQTSQLFRTAPPGTLRRHLRVDFMDEPGIDGGGILREWLHLVCSSLFSESQGLFQLAAGGQGYWIRRNAVQASSDRLQMFTFFGKILGKALLEGLILNVRLATPLLKHILGAPMSLADVKHIDEHIHSSIQYIQKCTQIDELHLTFSVASHDLIPQGSSVAVTDSNKVLYVEKLIKYYLFDSVESELRCILEGVRNVIADTLLHVFDHKELDLVISGLAEIDVADWQAHTTVIPLGHNQEDEDEVVRWFWEIVSGFTQRERSRLLQYVTGSSGLPVEGFAGMTGLDGQLQPFTIKITEKPSSSYTVLPYASTCYNRLDIPVYETIERLEGVLRMVSFKQSVPRVAQSPNIITLARLDLTVQVIELDVTGFNRR